MYSRYYFRGRVMSYKLLSSAASKELPEEVKQLIGRGPEIFLTELRRAGVSEDA